jgi:hypothetical protein
MWGAEKLKGDKFCKAGCPCSDRHHSGAAHTTSERFAGKLSREASSANEGWRRDGLAFVCPAHPAPLKRCGWCDELVPDGHVCPDMRKV